MKNAWDIVMKSSSNVYCSFCENYFLTFLPGGVSQKRANAQCPKCNSLERHRLMWYVIQDRKLFNGPLRMLHVAPEELFYNALAAKANIDYVPCAKFGDGYPDEYPAGTVDRDLTQMPDENNSYDGIICSHVLEHIPEDITAMKELYRILKPGGWAILQVPLDKSREKTYEDWSITDPKEREKRFGQWDHVRVYGLDYKERLESSGFDVEVIDLYQRLGSKDYFKFGFMDEDIYYCTK
ncbi:MAG: class I SAM-dependent methyltransferase [Cyclobacteriaceae bacterium]